MCITYPERPFKLQGHVVFPFVGSFRESKNTLFPDCLGLLDEECGQETSGLASCCVIL